MKLVSLLVILLTTATAQANVRLVHPTCDVTLKPNYSNDGINTIVNEAAKKYLSQKGFTVLDYDSLKGFTDEFMVMNYDLNVKFEGKKAYCKGILSLQGAIDESAMLLVNVSNKKGRLTSVANKCVKAVIKDIKDYPACDTVLDPTATRK